TILIGPDIRVMVVDIRGDKVRLGIDAPEDTNIVRAELEAENERLRSALAEPEETPDADEND
ncbi:MAG TPA: carbon storage regulator, partial [Phycisphaerae bacterium]|nr:carbon storage regulator [Phycisphaerae bacterium]